MKTNVRIANTIKNSDSLLIIPRKEIMIETKHLQLMVNI